MNTSHALDALSHEEIRAWLGRALRGEESLPLLTRDEFPHLGILRLEKTLKLATRDSLRKGALQLLRQFCRDGLGETAYLEKLLALVAAFKQPEAVLLLAQLAERFSSLPQVSLDIQRAVLGALVDMSPPQPVAFWERFLELNPEWYGGLALSGVLATNPHRAVALLPKMPNTERAGQATALKLDLTWDELPPTQRYSFVKHVQTILTDCGAAFANLVQAWLNSKEALYPAVTHSTLLTVLSKFLGPSEVKPKHRTPNLPLVGDLAPFEVLATHPHSDVKLLLKMPNTERAGQATALKLDLARDELTSKQAPPSKLHAGISTILSSSEVQPKHHTSKIFEVACDE